MNSYQENLEHLIFSQLERKETFHNIKLELGKVYAFP